jgi:glycerol-3-phosphate dehydrogenase
MEEHVIIIGGGGTGAALAHDLTLRGFPVSLLEKGEFFSGTTGRHHGLLHSGARYAIDDAEAATECIAENQLLRHLAPQVIEANDGLFVAINDDDMRYVDEFLAACATCHIPTRVLSPETALRKEPALNPELKFAVQVPDATFDAWRLPLCFLATAKANGADVRHFSEVIGVHKAAGRVNGIRFRDHTTQTEQDLYGDLVVNATGAWARNITNMAGIDVPVQPGPGVMVAIKSRVTNMVINRLHPAGEGDIIVPQRKLSILGTSLWLADDPDSVTLPPDHIQRMYDLCAVMVPSVKKFPVHAAWSASRPLIGTGKYAHPQQISRTFECYDHAVTDGIEGFVSIIGGKATTLRAMAEKTANLVCRKLERDAVCQTKDSPLLPYRTFYKTVD